MRRPAITSLAPVARLHWLPLAAAAFGLLTVTSGAAAAPRASAPPVNPPSFVSLIADAEATALAVGQDGALYTCGNQLNDATGSFGLTLTRYVDGQPEWARTWSDASGHAARAIDVAVAADGSVYVAATYYVAAYADGEPSAAPRPVLLKYSSNGELQWEAKPPFENIAFAQQLGTDRAGNAYICGTREAGGNQLTFLCRYAPDGTLDWLSTYRPGRDKGTYVSATDLLVTPAGTSYVVGSIRSSSIKGFEGFVRSWRANGTVRWTKLYGASGGTTARFSALTACPAGGIYAVGRCGTGRSSSSSLLVTRYKADGTVTMVRRFGEGDGRKQFATDVTTDDLGRIAVCGYWQAPSKGYYVALLRRDGSLAWSHNYAGDAFHYARSIATDGVGRVVVVGGPGPSPMSAGTPLQLYAFTKAGQPRWVSEYLPSGSNSVSASDMAVSQGSTLWVCGRYIVNRDPPPNEIGQMLLGWDLH